MPQVYAAGRISACPTPPTQAPPSAGEHAIPLAHGREALLFVPARLARPGSLLVMLHGAGGRPGQALSAVRGVAARQGVLVLAPLARAGTWDVIRGGFGPDVALLNETLAWTFDRFPVERAAIGGFSDGASYALSIGLGNGDLFSDVMAFSPGFASPGVIQGAPRIYISHGRRDEVLPFARCGEALAGRLSRAGYDVLFQPFQDGHIVPYASVLAAFARFLG